MKLKHLTLILLLLLASCKEQTTVSCTAPMIKLGNECCLDANNNSLCDDLETKPNESKKAELSDANNEYKEAQPAYPSLREIQSGINETYYPIKRYIFNDTDRYNLTGVENLFNVSGADRFYILQIKKEHNYLYNEKNFTDFIKRRYDLRVKNNEIWDQSHINAQNQTVYGWENVISKYDHSLEKIDIAGEQAFLEKHYEIFDDKGNLKDFYLEYKIDVWCTPELVVVIYPSDKFGFYYTIGSFVETEIRYVNGLLKKENKNMIEDAEKIIKLCKGKPDFMEFGPDEIIFYGMDGFYPDKVQMGAGQKLKLHNENDYNNAEIFTFIEEKSRKIFISNEINYTTYGEIQINESGNYTLFTPHYAGRANILVE